MDTKTKTEPAVDLASVLGDTRTASSLANVQPSPSPSPQPQPQLTLWRRFKQINDLPEPYRMDWFERKLKNLMDAAKGVATSFAVFAFAVTLDRHLSPAPGTHSNFALAALGGSIAMQLLVSLSWASTWRWGKARSASYVVSIGVFTAAIYIGSLLRT